MYIGKLHITFAYTGPIIEFPKEKAIAHYQKYGEVIVEDVELNKTTDEVSVRGIVIIQFGYKNKPHAKELVKQFLVDNSDDFPDECFTFTGKIFDEQDF